LPEAGKPLVEIAEIALGARDKIGAGADVDA
jgi:hypothetical protein